MDVCRLRSLRSLEVRPPFLSESVTYLVEVGIQFLRSFKVLMDAALTTLTVPVVLQGSGSSHAPFLLGFETVKTKVVSD